MTANTAAILPAYKLAKLVDAVVTHVSPAVGDFAQQERPNLLAELERVREELLVTDKLLQERDRVLKAVPACPDHGNQCVPHALDWIAKTQQEIRRLERDLGLERAIVADARAQFVAADAERRDLIVSVCVAKERIGYLETCKESDLRLIDALLQHHRASCSGCRLCNKGTPRPDTPRTDGETSTDGRMLT